MKKRLLAILMALGMMCSTSACAYAANADNALDNATPVSSDGSGSGDDSGIMPLSIDLYDNSGVSSGNGAFTSTEFTTTKGNGTTVRVWYRNDASVSAKVYLQKRGLLGGYSDVMNFTVKKGSNAWKEYTANGADSATYRILVSASSGKKVKGYLRAVQDK